MTANRHNKKVFRWENLVLQPPHPAKRKKATTHEHHTDIWCSYEKGLGSGLRSGPSLFLNGPHMPLVIRRVSFLRVPLYMFGALRESKTKQDTFRFQGLIENRLASYTPFGVRMHPRRRTLLWGVPSFQDIIHIGMSFRVYYPRKCLVCPSVFLQRRQKGIPSRKERTPISFRERRSLAKLTDFAPIARASDSLTAGQPSDSELDMGETSLPQTIKSS